MHIKNAQVVLDALKNGVECFTFSYGVDIQNDNGSYNDKIMIRDFRKFRCNTIGCVAGLTCLLLATEKQLDDIDVLHVGEEILQLTRQERDFLFYDFCEHATKGDAILRLEWLISGKPISEYPWHLESGPRDNESNR